jgi:hypothetical protein
MSAVKTPAADRASPDDMIAAVGVLLKHLGGVVITSITA